MCEGFLPVNYLEIDKRALKANGEKIKNSVFSSIIGVVKCDGYGIGIVDAAKIWLEVGAEILAVSQPSEALALRRAKINADILLMSPVSDVLNLKLMQDNDIILTVSGYDCARFYARNASSEKPLRVHVAVDCGMGRFGTKWTDIKELTNIYSMFDFKFEGIFSHFSASFEKKYNKTKLQFIRFKYVIDALENEGFKLGIRHIANSCAALRFPETQLDAVRIGSALIGSLCCPVPLELERVGKIKAQVVEIKHLEKGDTVGYGSIYKVRKDTNAAIVTIGHENGFSYIKRPDRTVYGILSHIYHTLRGIVSRAYVMYGDKKLPLIGRAGSQYSLFDIGNEDIFPGDYVWVYANMLIPHKRRRII